MTPDQLSAIRERLDAATWDDWEPVHTIHKKNLVCDEMVGFQACGPIVFCTEGGLSSDAANELSYVHMDLIANAPTDLRALLDEVERLTDKLQQRDRFVANHALGRTIDDVFKQGVETMRMAVLAEFERWFLAKEPTVSFVRSLQVLRVDENKP